MIRRIILYFLKMAELQDKTFTLNTGAKIPAIGFGTWKAGPGEAAAAVEAAFKAGYRHFVCVNVNLCSEKPTS
jgi:hypothetical protein